MTLAIRASFPILSNTMAVPGVPVAQGGQLYCGVRGGDRGDGSATRSDHRQRGPAAPGFSSFLPDPSSTAGKDREPAATAGGRREPGGFQSVSLKVSGASFVDWIKVLKAIECPNNVSGH